MPRKIEALPSVYWTRRTGEESERKGKNKFMLRAWTASDYSDAGIYRVYRWEISDRWLNTQAAQSEAPRSYWN